MSFVAKRASHTRFTYAHITILLQRQARVRHPATENCRWHAIFADIFYQLLGSVQANGVSARSPTPPAYVVHVFHIIAHAKWALLSCRIGRSCQPALCATVVVADAIATVALAHADTIRTHTANQPPTQSPTSRTLPEHIQAKL